MIVEKFHIGGKRCFKRLPFKIFGYKKTSDIKIYFAEISLRKEDFLDEFLKRF
jgi:hypothetical protein